MHRPSNLLLKLCLSSLVFSVSLVAIASVKTSATAIASSRIEVAGANPCASANPCAGKLGSVGGPLSNELQGKPVVVDIYASWCAACKNIAPTLSQLKQQYGDRVHFVVLDVSDKSASQQSESKAGQLGLGEFFAANKSKTGTVTIIDPATGNILAQHKNNPDLSAYTSVLNTELAKK